MSQKNEFVERWLPGYDGHQFYTRTYPATFPRAVILFVHGFAEHVARYESLHARFPPRSVAVFTFDQRGYGRTALDAAHKSSGASYAKTNWGLHFKDLEFFALMVGKEYPGVPLFMMGQSMGGALALAYFTRPNAPPSPEATKLFKGVIACSPFLTLTNPRSRLIRWTGGKMALLAPYMSFPADVGAENLSRSQAQIDKYLKDPLIKRWGTLRALQDMLDGGEKLVNEEWKRWPKDLPVLFIHGTADKVTSPKSTEAFHNKIDATDKKLSLFEGCYHELYNEIDNIPDRLFEECAHWIDARVPAQKTVVPSPSPTPTPAPGSPLPDAKL